ncbi:Hypothetical predicted protein [Paramuricea clavata]|uniref:Uncharacterized protein n=1 Tax=Paramuricea clavata TaxID=317549 RepID=A0A6S7IK65_PARCT|nr:Hypothetical predicted protein [Paramuricea clavata]
MFDKSNMGFGGLRRIVDAEMKDVHATGVTNTKAEKKAVTDEEENYLIYNRYFELSRSMRDNLLFFNIDEPTGEEKEDTTEIILALLEDKLEIPNARNKDKEDVLRNTKKLRGTRIGVQDQFPEEIERERKKLYPIMKEARQAGKHVRLACDKLYIDRHLYRPINS